MERYKPVKFLLFDLRHKITLSSCSKVNFEYLCGLNVSCWQTTRCPHVLRSTVSGEQKWEGLVLSGGEGMGHGALREEDIVRAGACRWSVERKRRWRWCLADRESQPWAGRGKFKFGTMSNREPLQVLKQECWLVSAALIDALGYSQWLRYLLPW